MSVCQSYRFDRWNLRVLCDFVVLKCSHMMSYRFAGSYDHLHVHGGSRHRTWDGDGSSYADEWLFLGDHCFFLGLDCLPRWMTLLQQCFLHVSAFPRSCSAWHKITLHSLHLQLFATCWCKTRILTFITHELHLVCVWDLIVCLVIFSSSYLYISPSYLHIQTSPLRIFTSFHLHIQASQPLIFSSSDLSYHIFASFHLRFFECTHIFTSSYSPSLVLVFSKFMFHGNKNLYI